MKYIKMLGLAAVAAMAMMAFLGAGTASATVLCKTNVTTGCGTGWHYPTGTTLHATLEPETSAVLKTTSESIVNTCTESTVHGTTTNTGSSTQTVDGKVATLTFGGCQNSTTVHQNENGVLEIHHIAGTDNGTVTATGFEVTMVFLGVTCTYGAGAGTDLGILKSGSPATMDINAVVPRITGSTFICPSHAIWDANYLVTSPGSLFVANS